MASKQSPTPSVLNKRVRELKFRIERFSTGHPLRMRLAGDDRGVSVDTCLHVVILKHFVFGIIFLCLVDIVCSPGDLAGCVRFRVILREPLAYGIGVALGTSESS